MNHYTRKGDGTKQKWSGWINIYQVYCFYGLLKIVIAVYLLLADMGGHLADAGYLKGYPILNVLIPTAYFLGTWWLSCRRPDELRSIGKWLVGPRAAHWFDPEPRRESKT
jgi:hypothetical protein